MPALLGQRNAQNGFTLLEVLIALVVLGLLMVGLTEGVRAGLSLRQAQLRRLDRTAELDAVMRGLRNILGGVVIVPDGVPPAAIAGSAEFRGEPNSVSFVGDVPTGLGTARRADMTLALRDGGRLVLSWIPHRHVRLFGPPPRPIETVLLQGVQQLELNYWGAPSRAQPAAWQARWVSPQAPELVRLRLSFNKGDPRRWPDLVVNIRP
jgi:general secretion pathway protein J